MREHGYEEVLITTHRMSRVCTYVYIRIAHVLDKRCLKAESAHFHWQIVGSSTLVRYIDYLVKWNPSLAPDTVRIP